MVSGVSGYENFRGGLKCTEKCGKILIDMKRMVTEEKQGNMRDRNCVAVVPAAGRSRRMGQFKPLLPWPPGTKDNGCVIESTVKTLLQAGLTRVVVVVGHRGEEIARRLARFSVTVLTNSHPDAPMSSSIRIAMAVVPVGAGVMVLPGDHPGVSVETVHALMTSAAACPDSIIIPVYKGRRGHPAYFPPSVRAHMENPDPDEGLRFLTRGAVCPVREIPRNDPGIRLNLDTPADYNMRFSGGSDNEK